jgi:hypothetical protein
MEQKIFMTKEVKHGENTYGQGLIYAVDQATKNELVSKGNAVALDFNRLDSIELAITSRVNAFKKEKDRIANMPAYNDAPSLREHEIQIREEQMQLDVAKLKQDYFQELDLYEKDLVKQALAVEHKTDANTASMLDSTLLQLQYSGNPELQLQLLSTKVNGMDITQKLTVLSKLHQLEEVVNKVASHNGNAKGYLERIKQEVHGVSPTAELDLKLQQLNVLRRDYASSVDLPLKQYKRVKGGK